METLVDKIFGPGFFLWKPVYMSLAFGLTCPLVGVYLVTRRLVFMGVALPQVSSCGIAFAFALQAWGLLPHAHDSTGEKTLAFIGSTVFTLAAILVLSLLARRGRGSVEARIGTVYVLAGAWSIILLSKNPLAEHGLLDLLKGEIISVSDFELVVTAGTFAVVIAMLWLFKKEFLLVSFDREMAVSLKKNVLFWDSFLFFLIGLTISMAVLGVGSLVTFGFLLLPPLTAHLFARDMRQFALLASGLGGVIALVGFVLAYRLDLPVGPTDVALMGVLYGIAFCARKLFDRSRPPVATAAQPQPSPR
jgi:ABC-type Mn2+/Zn2+ transport system permease subunit